MKQHRIIRFSGLFLLLGVLFGLAACNDWTEMEAVDNNVKKPWEQDPALWAEYTAALRDYKKSEHFIVYARLHNSPEPAASEKDFMRCLPDSLDIVALTNADNFSRYDAEDMAVMQPKRSYKLIERKAEVGETEIYDGGNYPSFPIVPLKNNKRCLSEIVGKRNTIDALDLASSNMVNNVDEGNLIYWVLSNCEGMTDLDDAKFVERLKTTHVAHANGDDGAKVESKTIEAPYEGTSSTIDMLKKKLYEDFQCFDAAAVSAGNQTATAIKASYVPLDLKTDKFESEVTRFIVEILRLAGIEDQPSYTRNQIINKSEETQNILLGAAYYDDEYITKKLLTINGDIDQYEDMAKRKAAEEIDRSFEDPDAPGVSGDGDQ